MWVRKNGFSFKNMAYFNSCFPCSLHIVLVNLGYLSARGDQIEDHWNDLHGDLNRTAPNELQIHRYLQHTDELAQRGVLYTPTSLPDRATTQATAQRIERDLVTARQSTGLIAGLGHAEVLFCARSGAAYHFRPSPDIESCVFERIKLIGVRSLEAPGADGRTEYAVGIEYHTETGEEEMHAAHFALTVR